MGIVEQVTGVFTEITEWIASTIPSIEAIFYNSETGLTFVGLLAVCGLAIAVFLLLMNIVKSFLQFR